MAIVDYISDDNPDAAQALKEDVEFRVSHLRDNSRLYRHRRVLVTVGLPTERRQVRRVGHIWINFPKSATQSKSIRITKTGHEVNGVDHQRDIGRVLSSAVVALRVLQDPPVTGGPSLVMFSCVREGGRS